MKSRPLFGCPWRFLEALRLTTRTGSLVFAAYIICLTAQPTPTRYWSGLLLALIGESIRLWAAGTIGKRDTLTTIGPYAYVRNPLYFGGALVAVGVLLLNGQILALTAAVAVALWFYPSQIKRETSFLLSRYGDAYRDYASKVPAFFPRLTPHTPGAVRSASYSFKLMKRNHELDAVAALVACLLILALPLRLERVQYLLVVNGSFFLFWAIRAGNYLLKQQRKGALPPCAKWRTEQATITLIPQFDDYAMRQFLEQIPGNLEQGTTMHEGRNKIVSVTVTLAQGSERLVVKQFRYRNPLQRLRVLLGVSKAKRAFDNARRLIANSFTTPQPIAVIEWRCSWFQPSSYLVTKELADVLEIRQVLSRPASAYAALLTDEFIVRIARFMAALHNAGFLHRDLSDGNLLFSTEPQDQSLILVDLNRMKRYSTVGIIEGIKDLIRIGVPQGYQELLITEYLARPGTSWLSRYYHYRKWWFSHWIDFKKRTGMRTIARRIGW